MYRLKRFYRWGLQLQRRLMRRLPPELASRLDQLRPAFSRSWGGPLNGQASRRELVREIAGALPFDRVIETGTHLGTSSEFFSETFRRDVDTVEAEPRFYVYSRRRFRDVPGIRVHQGDSRAFLTALDDSPGPAFFYLDAHWEEDLPLREELSIIAAKWPKAVVMIDDFQVPGDAGYQFDDYGPHARLTSDYLQMGRFPGWTLLYPTTPSAAESGARRGCCVLISPGMGDLADSLTLAAAV